MLYLLLLRRLGRFNSRRLRHGAALRIRHNCRRGGLHTLLRGHGVSLHLLHRRHSLLALLLYGEPILHRGLLLGRILLYRLPIGGLGENWLLLHRPGLLFPQNAVSKA